MSPVACALAGNVVYDGWWAYHEKSEKGFFFPWRNSSHSARASSLPELHDHSQTYTYTCYGSSGREIGPSQRFVPDNTQHSQETDIHVPSGIRTPNPSKRVAADSRYRWRSHQDRVKNKILDLNVINSMDFSMYLYKVKGSYFQV